MWTSSYARQLRGLKLCASRCAALRLDVGSSSRWFLGAHTLAATGRANGCRVVTVDTSIPPRIAKMLEGADFGDELRHLSGFVALAADKLQQNGAACTKSDHDGAFV